MKNSLRLFGLLAIIILFKLPVNAQFVSFGYDANGNRISREIILPVTNSHTNPDDPLTNGREILTVEEVTMGDVQVCISPNPNGGQFKVTLKGVNKMADARLYLHSANGQLIVEKERLEPETNIDIRNRQNGTYILTLIINGKKESWKVIKQ